MSGILIYCDEHPKRVRVVEAELRSGHGATWWSVGYRASQLLVADEPHTEESPTLGSMLSMNPVPEVRGRHRLACTRCDGLVVIRDDKLQAIMSRLAGAGVDRVSLRGLAAILNVRGSN